jgi:predicted metal-dependent phosphoesterase TrpH
MSPKRIVERARAMMLNIIGICDHNSAENVRAAKIVSLEKNITVLPGMEIASAEEVHIIALFEKIDSVLKLQTKVYKHLSPGENDEKLFGEQIIANEFDEVEGYNKRLLITATSITLKKLVEEIHNLDGLAIAAHIDRETYSIIGQLGFIPEDLELDALEISPITSRSEAIKKFPQIEKYPLICTSDAHFLQDIGCTSTAFLLKEPTISEVRKALRSENGREIIAEVEE